MAGILYLLREEASRTLLENGSTAAAALQVGELGFNNDVTDLSFSYKRRNGAGFVHVPTSERLAFYASAAVSGAKLSGYAPTSPLTATNVQDALDQLAGLTGGGGGGGLGGTLTTGKLPKASASNTLTDSILSESSSKILFSGDAVANLYRGGAGILESDGALILGGGINVGAGALVVGDAVIGGNGAIGGYGSVDKYFTMAAGLVWDSAAASGVAAGIYPSVTKNNSNSRTFSVVDASATLNAGGSNTNTTVNLIHADTVNTAVTGLTVNLINLLYGGAARLKQTAAGTLTIDTAASTSPLSVKLNGTEKFGISSVGNPNFFGVSDTTFSATGTLTNAPVSGNPLTWLRVNTPEGAGYIPVWQAPS